MSAKDRVLDELRRDYSRHLAKFPYCIAQAVGLSEPYTRRLLNQLAEEKQARRIQSCGNECVYQWRPPPNEGPITAAEAAKLAAECALRDAEHLEEMAVLAHRGGDLEGAKRELERAHERYQTYLANLNQGVLP